MEGGEMFVVEEDPRIAAKTTIQALFVLHSGTRPAEEFRNANLFFNQRTPKLEEAEILLFQCTEEDISGVLKNTFPLAETETGVIHVARRLHHFIRVRGVQILEDLVKTQWHAVWGPVERQRLRAILSAETNFGGMDLLRKWGAVIARVALFCWPLEWAELLSADGLLSGPSGGEMGVQRAMLTLSVVSEIAEQCDPEHLEKGRWQEVRQALTDTLEPLVFWCRSLTSALLPGLGEQGMEEREKREEIVRQIGQMFRALVVAVPAARLLDSGVHGELSNLAVAMAQLACQQTQHGHGKTLEAAVVVVGALSDLICECRMKDRNTRAFEGRGEDLFALLVQTVTALVSAAFPFSISTVDLRSLQMSTADVVAELATSIAICVPHFRTRAEDLGALLTSALRVSCSPSLRLATTGLEAVRQLSRAAATLGETGAQWFDVSTVAAVVLLRGFRVGDADLRRFLQLQGDTCEVDAVLDSMFTPHGDLFDVSLRRMREQVWSPFGWSRKVLKCFRFEADAEDLEVEIGTGGRSLREEFFQKYNDFRNKVRDSVSAVMGISPAAPEICGGLLWTLVTHQFQQNGFVDGTPAGTEKGLLSSVPHKTALQWCSAPLVVLDGCLCFVDQFLALTPKLLQKEETRESGERVAQAVELILSRVLSLSFSYHVDMGGVSPSVLFGALLEQRRLDFVVNEKTISFLVTRPDLLQAATRRLEAASKIRIPNLKHEGLEGPEVSFLAEVLEHVKSRNLKFCSHLFGQSLAVDTQELGETLLSALVASQGGGEEVAHGRDNQVRTCMVELLCGRAAQKKVFSERRDLLGRVGMILLLPLLGKLPSVHHLPDGLVLQEVLQILQLRDAPDISSVVGVEGGGRGGAVALLQTAASPYTLHFLTGQLQMGAEVLRDEETERANAARRRSSLLHFCESFATLLERGRAALFMTEGNAGGLFGDSEGEEGTSALQVIPHGSSGSASDVCSCLEQLFGTAGDAHTVAAEGGAGGDWAVPDPSGVPGQALKLFGGRDGRQPLGDLVAVVTPLMLRLASAVCEITQLQGQVVGTEPGGDHLAALALMCEEEVQTWMATKSDVERGGGVASPVAPLPPVEAIHEEVIQSRRFLWYFHRAVLRLVAKLACVREGLFDVEGNLAALTNFLLLTTDRAPVTTVAQVFKEVIAQVFSPGNLPPPPGFPLESLMTASIIPLFKALTDRILREEALIKELASHLAETEQGGDQTWVSGFVLLPHEQEPQLDPAPLCVLLRQRAQVSLEIRQRAVARLSREFCNLLESLVRLPGGSMITLSSGRMPAVMGGVSEEDAMMGEESDDEGGEGGQIEGGHEEGSVLVCSAFLCSPTFLVTVVESLVGLLRSSRDHAVLTNGVKTLTLLATQVRTKRRASQGPVCKDTRKVLLETVRFLLRLLFQHVPPPMQTQAGGTNSTSARVGEDRRLGEFLRKEFLPLVGGAIWACLKTLVWIFVMTLKENNIPLSFSISAEKAKGQDNFYLVTELHEALEELWRCASASLSVSGMSGLQGVEEKFGRLKSRLVLRHSPDCSEHLLTSEPSGQAQLQTLLRVPFETVLRTAGWMEG
uniref:Uncharacterized protein n=1 Tax=Chromera velia CCMP2878 TaxID=1169474 RepID=A0A0G4FRZ7_9ALVE|eukprot:Cvel_3659.t1-p1 / transcript=Cvel_3659.t1 / gene=Cvel_3659 / organism=Chromera_velia_CCMP2878 / gene_product=hypothetical protein / transcript_product=hypothetical protein / location=Cvel_scaffold151:81586-88397(+) / protein_length=1573 / sequence_SO=supercontig / SO=protein_coding / is_pseudo=false